MPGHLAAMLAHLQQALGLGTTQPGTPLISFPSSPDVFLSQTQARISRGFAKGPREQSAISLLPP